MSEYIRCKDCKHDNGKCVGSCRKGSHKNCFEPKRMTNAERIRAMIDEELADFLSQWGTSTRVWQKDYRETLYWLQQPAEEDEHA